jgi:hypothetical protein
MLGANKNQRSVVTRRVVGDSAPGRMQYNEDRLAQLAATVAAGFARNSKLLDGIADKQKTRAEARNLAQVSLMVARHIMVAAHCAAQKVDELELLYDDADFL